ncbi:MAG: hypothetical protein HQL66_01905 [Magnetococcales bacterium]|nr:hypothetical protein [Magnetococcales bacterium]
MSALFLVVFYYREQTIELYAGYHINYFVSIFFIIFWFIVLRLNDSIILNVVVLATSLLFGIYLIEMTINIRTVWVVTKLNGMFTFDQRKASTVLKEMRAHGEDVVLYVSPADFIKNKVLSGDGTLYPLGGISGQTTIFCDEGGKHRHYRSDRHGFNNPDTAWEAPETDWLLTGDSFTHGFCVDPGEDIAGQMRVATGESVLNLGSGGDGPLLELATLKEFAASHKPKRVIWLYFEGNDLSHDLPVEKSIPTLMNYLDPNFSQDLPHRQAEVDRKLERYVEQRIADESGSPPPEPSLARKILFLQAVRTYLYGMYQQRVIVDPLFARILTAARDRVAAWGGQLYFVYLPEWDRYKGIARDHDAYKKRREVIDLARGLHLPVIDIHQEVFLNYPDRFSLFPYYDLKTAHYNAKGYAAVAKAIVTAVQREEQGHPNQPPAAAVRPVVAGEKAAPPR